MNAPPAESSPDHFRFIHDVDVRFRDIDPMGHAHHTLPLIYWEEARATYWREVAGRETVDAIDYVMGEFSVKFHGRIHFPARLRAGVRTTRLGGKSFDMAYALWDADGALLSTGTSAQVMYDYEAGRSRAIDEETRRRIQEFEGRELGG